ncbi:hypothetical protein GCM10022600_23450 [Qipengyuania pelagi]
MAGDAAANAHEFAVLAVEREALAGGAAGGGIAKVVHASIPFGEAGMIAVAKKTAEMASEKAAANSLLPSKSDMGISFS